MEKELLQELGLTATEATVYLTLIKLGPAPVGRLFNQTGIHRKNLYDSLSKLCEKGLVTYIIENKRKYFQPKDTDNLLRYIEKQKNKLEKDEKKVKGELIPALRKSYLSLPQETEACIYRGTEGLKSVLNECLNHGEVLFIGATGDVESRLPYFWPQYNEKRIKSKVLWRLLLIHEARTRPITKSKYYKYKILPKELSSPNVIYIYGDHVANVLWLEKPLAFVIRHKSLAETYKKYFNYLWDGL